MFLGRFIAFFRAVMPALAGTARMPYLTFLAYNAAGGVCWGVGFVLLGYLAGNSYQRIAKTVGTTATIVAGRAHPAGARRLAHSQARQHDETGESDDGVGGSEPMSGSALFIAVFLACVVEAVEALTIVLAAGTARDWRSALTGVAAGLVVLAALVAVLGPAISAIPLSALRLFVGGLLLIFGLQWLRKAILRASGHKALHDEALIFQGQLAAADAAPVERPPFRTRLVRLHPRVQGRGARGARGRVHRADVRQQPGQHPARGTGRRRCRGHGRRCRVRRHGPRWLASRRTR